MFQRVSETSEHIIIIIIIIIITRFKTHKKPIIRSTTSMKAWKIIFYRFRQVFLYFYYLEK